MALRRVLLATIAILAARIAEGACDDPAAVAAARSAVEAGCPCAAAVDRPSYLSCGRTIVRQRVEGEMLPAACARPVLRCVSRSTCGRPGAVTCCRTKATGVTKCQVRRSAAQCQPPPNGSACVGVFASCCDACTSSGCVAPSTTTTTSTTVSTSTTTTTLPATPCSGGSIPTCGDGVCPAGFFCALASGDVFPGCYCHAVGTTACSDGPFPTCGGDCPFPGTACQPARGWDGSTLIFEGCLCNDADAQCGDPTGGVPQCAFGACPAGEVCAAILMSGDYACDCQQ